jgi:uncharacterized protein (DUF2164 family)
MKFLSLLLLPVLISSTPSELRVGLNELALMQGLIIFSPYVEESLSSVPTDDFELDLDQLSLTFMNVVSEFDFDLSQADVSFSAPNLINMYLFNFEVFQSFACNVLLPAGTQSSTGNLTMTSSDTSISVAITNKNGAPQVQIEYFVININSAVFQSQLDSSLNQQINNLISEDLSNIQTLLCQYLTAEVSKMNAGMFEKSFLYSLPGLNSWLNLQLADDVTIEGSYVALPFRGQLLNMQQQPYSQFVGMNSTQMTTGLGFMAQVSDGLSSDWLSLHWAQYSKVVTMLPKGLPVQLTTSGLKELFPKLHSVYGKDKPMHVRLQESSVWPRVQIKTQGSVQATAGVMMSFYVEGAQEIHALDVHLKVQAEVMLNWTSKSLGIVYKNIEVVDAEVTYSPKMNIHAKSLVADFGKVIKKSMRVIGQDYSQVKVPMFMIPHLAVVQDNVAVNSGFVTVQLNGAAI